MWIYLLQGIGYGFAAASQPGPFQTYLISQTLTRGWKRTLPAALAPLLSDGPIILICILVLSQVPDWFQRILYVAGGFFILYLSYGAFNAWRNFDVNLSQPVNSGSQSFLKAVLVNGLSPVPYIYWTLVTGPILVRGWREATVNGIGFLAGFYATLVLGLATIILVFGIARKFGNRFNRIMVGISAIALFCFGLYQLWLGLFGI